MGYTLYTLNCKQRYARPQFRNIENCMVAVSLIIGGDWIRQGEFAVGSKPWSPRHVKQG